jgi:LacI family transcriptional regulator
MENSLSELNIPIVYIGQFPFYDCHPYISTKFIKYGEMAAKFFIDHGFSRVAYIGNNPWGNFELVYEEYKKTANKLGCECFLYQIENIVGGVEDRKKKLEIHEQLIKEWLLTLPKPIGLFSNSDKIASRHSSICINAGLRIPEDVAILSIGNNAFLCETAQVSISSIETPWAQMWSKSFHTLNDLINNKKISKEHILIEPQKIVERKSTDVLPIDDPLTAKAVRYIWDNYDKDIGVESFLKKEKVSRSTLQRKLKKCLKRGFNEEVKRKRLEVSKRFLLNSKMTSQEISLKSGFQSQSYFHKVFLEEFSYTPNEYRKSLDNSE